MAENPEELKRDIEQTRREVGRDVDALTEKVSPGRVAGRQVERARGGVHRLKERVMGSVESAGGSVSGAVSGSAGSAVSTVQDAGGRVGDAVGSAPEVARARTRGTPLAAGLIAFAAGWVAAAAVPASTAERELAHDTKDKAMEAAGPVREQAAQVAQEVRGNLQEPAQEAVENVKQSASQAAGEVAGEGRSAAQQVADGAKDSAGTVRQAGSPS